MGRTQPGWLKGLLANELEIGGGEGSFVAGTAGGRSPRSPSGIPAGHRKEAHLFPMPKGERRILLVLLFSSW